jgi:dihydroorotate dehydrogenase
MASRLFILCRAGGSGISAISHASFRDMTKLRLPLSPAGRAGAPRCCGRSVSSSTCHRPRPQPKTMLQSSSMPTWKIANIFLLSLGVLAITWAYATDTRARIHAHIIPRVLRAVFPDAEDAHIFGTAALRVLHSLGLHPRERANPARTHIPIDVFGTTLTNPIGISAGLDKHAEIPDALFALGAAVVEVGGCTPRAQSGNPRPRLFRLPRIDGLVNRYGLNSVGADVMAARLRERVRRYARDNLIDGGEQAVLDGDAGVPPGSLQPGRLLLVQIAKQKETKETDLDAVAADYVYCVRRLAPYADVLVVNVSSPNTPGLRDLQATGPLTKLLSAVVDEAARTPRRTRPRVMVKVSPDEDTADQIEGIARAVASSGVDGVIVGNTTKRRAGVVPEGVRLPQRERAALDEDGGFSGPALFDRTLALVSQYRRILDRDVLRAGGGQHDRKVIFATGGITDGERALKVLDAGASVAMVYTGLVYGGVGTITAMKEHIRKELDRV